MSRSFVAVLAVAWGVTALACAGQKNTAPPTIHVNQRGLAERIDQASSAPHTDSNEVGTAPQTTPADDKSDDEHGSSQAAEQEEGAPFPGIIRKDPSPSESAERVAFQRVEAEKKQEHGHAPSPSVDFDSLRDSRTQKFRHRENARSRQ